ncbi:MAG TPA: hypothetical protein VM368_04415, partial [Flavisolibacter sp.]|nr:hypothetical protein [Flavisolibacter sp.]
MNNKAIPFSILLFFQCLICYSQKVEEKFHFNSINQGGLLAGASDGTGLLQSINGVLHKTFFAGIGVGLDYY